MPRLASIGRSSSILLIAVAAALCIGALWFWRSQKPTSNPAHEPEQQPPPAVQVPGDDWVSEPAMELPSSPKEEAVRTTAIETATTEPAAGTSVEFHVSRKVMGQVVPSSPLPADESITVALQTYTSEPSQDSSLADDYMNLFGNEELWQTVATAPARADGTFQFPRPLNVGHVRLNVEGDYTAGSFQFAVEGDQNPGDSPITINATVGAHVTLRLDVQDSAETEALAALEGDHLTFNSTGPSIERTPFAGSPYSCEATLNAGGEAVLKGVEAYDWEIQMSEGDTDHQDLSPFFVTPGFHFEPEAGTRVVIDVPIQRGRRFEGVVQDADGRPIERARLAIQTQWNRGGKSGSQRRHRITDADGRFCFQALDAQASRMTCTTAGFLKYELEPDELETMLAAPTPHFVTLVAGRSLTIQVTAENGLPAQGVLAIIISDDDPQAFRRQTTGDDGTASFVGLPPGPLTLRSNCKLILRKQSQGAAYWKFQNVRLRRGDRLTASDPSVETLWSATVSLAGDDPLGPTVLSIPLQRTPIVQGRVIGADPDWPSPIRILVEDGSQEPTTPLAFRLSGSSRSAFAIDPATGRFSGQLPSGQYTARAVSSQRTSVPPHPGSPPVYATPEVKFEVASSEVDLQLSFAASKAVTGTVTSVDGTPLPGTAVRLFVAERWGATITAATRTDDAGEFSFESVSPGSYFVRVMSSRFHANEPHSLHIKADQPVDHLRIEMAPAGSVRVAQLGPEAVSEALPKVSVMTAQGENTWVRPIEDDAQWKGALGPLLPGNYIVVTTQTVAGGLPMLIRSPVEIRAGELAAVTVQALEAPVATASGTITSGGEPIERIPVALTMGGHTMATAATDALGHYTMHVSEAGTMTLGEIVAGSQDDFSFQVELGTGPNTLPTIDLPTGAIEGQLDGSRGMSKIPAVYRQGDALDGPPFRRCTSLANGHFRIPFLPDGQYVIMVYDQARSLPDTEGQVAVTVSGGDTVRGVELGKR